MAGMTGDEFRINQTTSGNQTDGTGAILTGGNAVAVWVDGLHGPPGTPIRAMARFY